MKSNVQYVSLEQFPVAPTDVESGSPRPQKSKCSSCAKMSLRIFIAVVSLALINNGVYVISFQNDYESRLVNTECFVMDENVNGTIYRWPIRDFSECVNVSSPPVGYDACVVAPCFYDSASSSVCETLILGTYHSGMVAAVIIGIALIILGLIGCIFACKK